MDINRKDKAKTTLLRWGEAGGWGGEYTGPSIDVSCNGGSVTSHKMKLFITPLPPKEGTEHGENETY